MRVLMAFSGTEAQRLVTEAEALQHTVIRCEVGLGAEQVALRIRREFFDLVVVSAAPDLLSMDVVDACDSRGVLLVAVVNDRAGSENAIACGVSEVVSPWQEWADVVRAGCAGDDDRERAGLLEHTESRKAPLRVLPERHSLDARSGGAGGASVAIRASPSAGASLPEPVLTSQAESRVVTVWGPTGAPGRTTVAVNLAATAAARGNRVLLIDADTYGGAVAIRCGVFDEAPGVARACRLAGAGSLTTQELESLAHHVKIGSQSMQVVTGILGSARWPEITRERLEKVIELARETYDTVVLDVGFSLETDEEVSSDMLAPRRNGATLAAMRASTDIVAVSAADSVGLARYIRLWSDLTEVNPDARLTAVVNRVVARKEGTPAHDNIASTFSRFAGIRDVVLIADDVDLATRADVRGEPACVIDSQSRFAAAIGEIARRAIGLDVMTERAGLREKLRGLRLLG